MQDVHIGTSGWNYPAGRGTWNGVFYPPRRPRGFDELAYYAEHFDTVEVNATFYRVPEPALSLAWLKRTPPTFTFAVKLYQKFTHPKMYVSRPGVTAWDVTPGDLDAFRAGIEPLASAGRLAALLLQFPASFHATDETRAYLAWLLRAFEAYPLAVELRHRTWNERQAIETRGLLAAHGAALVLDDSPEATHSSADLVTRADDTTSPHAPLYIRLHGRNAKQWWDHERAEDRYDYLYAPTELAPFAEAARAGGAAGKRVLMYLNNHFSAKAVANAVVLKQQLGDLIPGDYPPEMLHRYPDLAGLIRTTGLPI
jgi:uncharacterized protein YecE (DUF72 family)